MSDSTHSQRREPLRPQIIPYQFHRLKQVPMRLWRAPPLPDWMSIATQPSTPSPFTADERSEKRSTTSKSTTFRKVRSFARSTMSEVKLSDVLSGKHMPPLTLREFEDYLAHVERSPENLYFIFWLKNYHQEYRAWETSLLNSNNQASSPDKGEDVPEITIRMDREGTIQSYTTSPESLKPATTPTFEDASVKTSNVPLRLQRSFQLAMTTFFATDPTSPSILELNMSSSVTKQTQIDADHSFDPSIFKAAKSEALGMLESSMRAWITHAAGNADNQRVAFAVVVGMASILGAIACSLVAYYKSPHRLLRLVSLPILFLGVATFSCSLHRMCPILWLFAPARQCHSWELIRQSATENDNLSLTPSKSHNIIHVPLTSVRVNGRVVDEEKKVQHHSSPTIPDWDNSIEANEHRQAVSSPWSKQFTGRGILPQGLNPKSVPTRSIPTGADATSMNDCNDNQSITSSNHSNLFTYFNLTHLIFPNSRSPNSNDLSRQSTISLPTSSSTSSSSSLFHFKTPMFAPVTRVLNPWVNRFQRKVILQSSIWALVCVVIWIPTWLLLPARH